jgi:chromate transporter
MVPAILRCYVRWRNARPEIKIVPNMPDSTAPEADAQPYIPTVSEIFFGFLGIAVTGFGGVMPWAQRMLIDKKRWLTAEKFAEDLALAQFLPGPNIVNLSIVVGSRFRGPLGAIAAAVGVIGAPSLLMIVCGELYVRYGDVAWLRGPLAGLSTSAVGLILAMVMKLAAPMLRARHWHAIAFAVAAFMGVVALRLPLWWVLLGLGSLSIAVFWWRQR